MAAKASIEISDNFSAFPIKLQCKLWQWLMAILNFWSTPKLLLGRRGRDPIVVGYITTYVISAYYHVRCEFESQSGEVYSIQHYATNDAT
jgi:hypothetical protein